MSKRQLEGLEWCGIGASEHGEQEIQGLGFGLEIKICSVLVCWFKVSS